MPLQHLRNLPFSLSNSIAGCKPEAFSMDRCGVRGSLTDYEPCGLFDQERGES